MNDDDKYLFDLNGYILIEEVLDQDEIAAANEAIDRHLDHGKYRDRELPSPPAHRRWRARLGAGTWAACWVGTSRGACLSAAC